MSTEPTGDMGDRAQPLSHRRLEERAYRERWDIPPDVARKIQQRLVAVVDPETVHDREPPSLREVTAAARALIGASLATRKLDLEERKFDRSAPPEANPLDRPRRIVIPGTDERSA